MRITAQFTITVIGATLSGCSHLRTFEAEPKYICASEVVTVTWDAPQGSILATVPEVFEKRAVEGSGHVTVPLRTGTTFTLFTPDKDFPIEPERVEVVPEKGSQLLGGKAVCLNGQLSVHFYLPEKEWSPQVRVETISTTGAAPLLVDHAGKSVLVEDGEENEDFKGNEVNGDWSIVYSGPDRENCDVGPNHLPRKFGIDAKLMCSVNGHN